MSIYICNLLYWKSPSATRSRKKDINSLKKKMRSTSSLISNESMKLIFGVKPGNFGWLHLNFKQSFSVKTFYSSMKLGIPTLKVDCFPVINIWYCNLQHHLLNYHARNQMIPVLSDIGRQRKSAQLQGKALNLYMPSKWSYKICLFNILFM